MKKTDLEKLKGLKINSKLNQAGTPGRFAAGAHDIADRREQRRRDQALGLVPFAVKLDGDLVAQIQARAEAQGVTLNDVVADLIRKGLAA